ncbi:glycosyltransferase family 25 protein [Mesorhizobium sp. CO1-1-7]|uniref:glycosyltransferase family 25 protein n=1 Tax=unclassified Mesorhizobium TaxID=325217 RepID=UPI00112CE4D1|nr:MULTISPECIES: glycosyltransferase family 25 protein [unclassified Mesorhizobium]MBZ9747557.1 glycosyltransferase family 25 protein [Mesorhizobium sp. CO1-1-7]TPL99803.1 hypothetical protein FJ943_15455 [Mesorhizobium sp. B2-3-10]
MTDPTGQPARLLTAFNTVLYVDTAKGELRHGPEESSPANVLFVATEQSAGGAWKGQLICRVGDKFKPMICIPDQTMILRDSIGLNPAAMPTLFELVPLERGLLALRAEALFLSAIPDGRVLLGAPVCSTWELFIASESWCTQGTMVNGSNWRSAGAHFDKGRIQSYIVHPTLRAKANTHSKGKKILVYGYTKWSHGRVYYDLARRLHACGFTIDILDWQGNNNEHIGRIVGYYDLYLTALDGVPTLTDSYGIPCDKIVAISHHEFDMRMLIERKGIEIFDKFANYGVVSEYLYSASAMRGISRIPKVAPLGIDYQSFFSAVPERLTTVGYATSMSVTTYGVEWKRGALAEAATQQAGLAFKVAGSTASQISFHDMPEFYRSVDAVLSSSINESGPLSVMEGAAAGRLIIGTPVGHFPLKAYQGGGILAPIEAAKFEAFTAATLRYYKENTAAFVEKCHATREAARQFDWQYSIGEWIDLFDPQSGTRAHRTIGSQFPASQELAARIGGPQREHAQPKASSTPLPIRVINLDRSVSRWNTYQKRNPHLLSSTLRVSAFEGAALDRGGLLRDGIIGGDCTYGAGSLGCALSHITLWKEAVASNIPLTIFEDDVYCSADFISRSNELLSGAPAGWDLIKWGFNFDPLFLWLDLDFAKAKLEFYARQRQNMDLLAAYDKSPRSLSRIAHSFGLMAYSVTPNGARILLENCLPIKRRTIQFPGAGVVIDDTGIDCAMCAAYGLMQAFVCMPPLVFSDDDQLSIREESDRTSGSVVS